VESLVDLSQAVIEQGSKSFAAAARLFAPDTRAGAYMLYAWCRHCDDVTDDQKLGFESSRISREEGRARVEHLQETTRAALAGEPVCDPVFKGLQQVVARHEIPDRFSLEHLNGFVMDVEGRVYNTLEDTIDYCYHVAGVVGIMMAYVMGVRDEPTLDRATDLGLAFQLTNICRDVVEDARVGRVYLPKEWLDEAGVPVDRVGETDHREGVFRVVRRVLKVADDYYESARLGVSQLPFRSAWAVAAANAVYRDIGRLILKRGPRAWDQRVSTGRNRKIALVLGSGPRALAATTLGPGPSSRPRTGLWVRPGRSPLIDQSL
jgi:phytoene synthase